MSLLDGCLPPPLDLCFFWGLLFFLAWISSGWLDLWSSRVSLSKLGAYLPVAFGALGEGVSVLLTAVVCTCSSDWCDLYLSHRSSVLRLVWSALKQWDSAAVCGKAQQRSWWWAGRGLLMDPGEQILGSGTVWLASRSLAYSSDCYGLFLSWWSLSVLGESTDQREDKSERMWGAEGVFREQVPGVGQSSWQMGHSLAASCSSD